MTLKILILCIYITLTFFLNSSIAAVGLVVALNSTFESFEKNLSKVEKKTIARREFLSGDLWGGEVVLVRSPMGKVGNAITTQILIDLYQIDAVVSISPAGGIGDQLSVGDIVVATEVYQHDFGTEKPYGFIWGGVPDGSTWEEPGYRKSPRRARQRPAPNLHEGGGVNKILEGVVVSGDQFIQSPTKKEWLLKKFNALAVDMGAASIAQVCYENKKPVYIYRIITDKADLGARPSFERNAFGYKTKINMLDLFREDLKSIYKNYLNIPDS